MTAVNNRPTIAQNGEHMSVIPSPSTQSAWTKAAGQIAPERAGACGPDTMEAERRRLEAMPSMAG